MGFHVIHVDDVTPGKVITLGRVSGKIADKIFREKLTKRRREWVTELKRAAFWKSATTPAPRPAVFPPCSRRSRADQLPSGRHQAQEKGGLFGQDRVWDLRREAGQAPLEIGQGEGGRGSRRGKDAIGALAAGHRLFVSPDPSANIYLFRYVYLLPDSFIGKVSFADMIKRSPTVEGRKRKNGVEKDVLRHGEQGCAARLRGRGSEDAQHRGGSKEITQ